MSDAGTSATGSSTTSPNPLTTAYRHDVHKLRGRAHEYAADTVAGLPVNEAVPHGADGDAAALSRPDREPTVTVENHQRPARLSLLTGTPVIDSPATLGTQEIRELIDLDDSVRLHRRWLGSDRAGALNESLFYPYTSLKHHVLLTAALLAAYRNGWVFGDLHLEARQSGEIQPHRTILHTPELSLRLTPDPSGAHAPLGPHPAPNFADTWARLSGQPLAVDNERRWRLLDAQLRRLRSWSTALAYIEDYLARFVGDRR